jgi:hypothetical protein
MSCLSKQLWRDAHRPMLREMARQYRQTHPQKIRETAASRRRYLAERVKRIELNDDPESLLYVGNFE